MHTFIANIVGLIVIFDGLVSLRLVSHIIIIVNCYQLRSLHHLSPLIPINLGEKLIVLRVLITPVIPIYPLLLLLVREL